ncbi:uncharacterized protein METZ01_LOCUS427381, partial [marine metagenome]
VTSQIPSSILTTVPPDFTHSKSYTSLPLEQAAESVADKVQDTTPLVLSVFVIVNTA